MMRLCCKIHYYLILNSWIEIGIGISYHFIILFLLGALHFMAIRSEELVSTFRGRDALSAFHSPLLPHPVPSSSVE